MPLKYLLSLQILSMTCEFLSSNAAAYITSKSHRHHLPTQLSPPPPLNVMENQPQPMVFDMGALRSNLPKKRGLSRYYSGKSRSFVCMADVHRLEDLQKPEHPDHAKKRKKHSDRKDFHFPQFPCRRVSSTTQCA